MDENQTLSQEMKVGFEKLWIAINKLSLQVMEIALENKQARLLAERDIKDTKDDLKELQCIAEDYKMNKYKMYGAWGLVLVIASMIAFAINHFK